MSTAFIRVISILLGFFWGVAAMYFLYASMFYSKIDSYYTIFLLVASLPARLSSLVLFYIPFVGGILSIRIIVSILFASLAVFILLSILQLITKTFQNRNSSVN